MSGLTGERAVQVLAALEAGQVEGVSRGEAKELAALGLVSLADPGRLARARAYLDLERRYGVRTSADAQRQLVRLDGRLRSWWHRAFSSAATLRREERDRAWLRAMSGAMGDDEEWPRMRGALDGLRAAGPSARWATVDGAAVAISAEGLRVGAALELRVERYGGAPLGAFVKRYRKAEAGMRQLATDCAYLLGKVRPGVAKGAEHVVVGLVKSGLAPDQALARWQRARGAVRGRLAVEVPHAAVAVVRAAAEHGDQAERRLDAAVAALVAAGMSNEPVLRGAAKVLLTGEPAPGARRFKALFDGLRGSVRGDDRVRAAARLFPAAGSVEQVVARHVAAQGGGLSPLVAAAIAAGSGDEESLRADVQRYGAIARELVKRGAFPHAARVPASAADLVGVPGAPAEVVELVRQLVGELPAHVRNRGWGESPDWATAVAFARRFAY